MFWWGKHSSFSPSFYLHLYQFTSFGWFCGPPAGACPFFLRKRDIFSSTMVKFFKLHLLMQCIKVHAKVLLMSKNLFVKPVYEIPYYYHTKIDHMIFKFIIVNFITLNVIPRRFTGGVTYAPTPDKDSDVYSYPHSSEQLYRKVGAISTSQFGYSGFKKGRNTRE